ncbi:MAG TPA: CpaD family pilus assembly lipoprotein [Stellaceae bacterium]|nr:CpaD family pilus assembly lipoprotein [Stellaceae bacterium]
MKTRLIILLAIASAALAACDSTPDEWTSTQAPRQLRVDFQRLTHATAFPSGSAQLAQGERDSLLGFLHSAEVSPDDTIYLEAADEDKLSNNRVSALVRDLSRKGYSLAMLPAKRDAIPPDSLLVVVERYVVTPPDCPNWTKSPNGDHENAVSSDFGCANLTNLGLMVADPRDLVMGRDLGPADAEVTSLAIQRYRAGKTSPLAGTSAGTTYNFVPIAPGGSTGSSTGQ